MFTQMNKIAPLLVLIILFTGCSQQNSGVAVQKTNDKPTTTQTTPQETPVANTTDKSITLAELANHTTKDDCWLAVEGKVYNVTNFIDQHPGGDRILKGCGKDATQLFNSIEGGRGHSDFAKSTAKDFYIGVLAK